MVKVFFSFSKLSTFLPSPQLALGLMGGFGGVQKIAQRGKPVRSFPLLFVWGLHGKNVKGLLVEKG